MGDQAKTLAEVSLPDDRVPAWHRDPLGVAYWRWWDGERWTEQTEAGPQQRAAQRAPAPERPWWRPGWRKMTWVVVVWCVVMAIWIIAAIAGADNAAECAKDAGGLSQQTCIDARDAGTGIGVVILWIIWFFGFVALSLIWFMTRPRGRDCPACGVNVKKGRTECPACGHDFAAAARSLGAA